MNKPILCLDFDGVIHSYSSGWKGASVIPDPPVEGALQFIVEALERFDVQIFSSRSHQWGGKRAMKAWLKDWLLRELGGYACRSNPLAQTPAWAHPAIAVYGPMEPWPHDIRETVDGIMRSIRWPWFKPAAMVTLDDRAITFTGTWPALAELRAFKPWNKK